MPRSTNSVPSKRRRNKVLKQAKGFVGKRHSSLRTAKEAVDRAMQYAYRDRRNKKRVIRSLWITRINAAARLAGVSYSKFMAGLKEKDVALNRKMLAEIAVRDQKAFNKIVELSNS
ncbi:MAG: 50S ribosomal protein L20 [Calditrichaeota bacterium]|nr:MAG: 50S ribosomal protein L20 [Calditrichota bacterium]